MAQNNDLVANAQTLLEENLSEKKSVESARRLYSNRKEANNKEIFKYSCNHENLLSNNRRIYMVRLFHFDCNAS